MSIFSFISETIISAIIASATLSKFLRMLIFLSMSIVSTGYSLGMGVWASIFHSLGYSPRDIQLFSMLHRGTQMYSAYYLITEEGISPGTSVSCVTADSHKKMNTVTTGVTKQI